MLLDDDDQQHAGRAEHRDEIEPVIRNCLSALTTAEAVGRLEAAGIATARVNDMAGLWKHEQLAARQRWAEFGSPAGPLPGLKPITGKGWQPRMDPVPALGEHTEAIRAEFGLPFTSPLDRNDESTSGK